MAEAVQNHVKSLNWGHRVQLQDRYGSSLGEWATLWTFSRAFRAWTHTYLLCRARPGRLWGFRSCSWVGMRTRSRRE